MTDLSATKRHLEQLYASWAAAWALHLDMGPGAQRYEPHRSASGGTTRPIPVRLDPDTGDVTTSPLAADYAASVRQLRHAVVAASELSWIPDDVAQAAVLPDRERISEDRRTHVPFGAGQRMVREVRLALEGAQWRDQRGVLTFADTVHLAILAEQVYAALCCMPDELVVAPSRPVRPTLKRCLGGPGRSTCSTEVPWARVPGYCNVCGPRVLALVEEYPGHRGDPCRNPFDRGTCRGEVAVPKYSLCKTCDDFRRNVLRQTAA